MKSILIVLSLILSFQSLAQPKGYEKHKVFKKHKNFVPKKFKKRELLKSFKDLDPESKIDKLIKRGHRIDFYKSKYSDKHSHKKHNSKNKHYKHKVRKFFKKFLKRLKGQFQITEIDNNDDDLLKIKITDSKNKYTVKNIRYKLESYKNESNEIKTYSEGKDVFADIDIKDIPVGKFDIYFKLEAYKIQKHGKRKRYNHKKLKVFYTRGEFEKVESQKVFSTLTLEQFENRAAVLVDASETYSTAGNISKYIYRSFLSGSLVDEVESTESSMYLYFNAVGDFEIEVTAIDELGNEDTSARSIATITNPTPVLKYKLIEEETSGHYSVDTTGTTDENGTVAFIRITLYSTVNGVTDYFYDYLSYEETTTFVIPESNREFTLRIRAYDDTNQFSQAFEIINFEGIIAPRISGYYIGKDDFTPFTYYVGAGFEGGSEIVEYHYTATHEDGTEATTFADLTNPDNGFDLPKPGLWTFEFYGVDSNGQKSNTVTETRDIQ